MNTCTDPSCECPLCQMGIPRKRASPTGRFIDVETRGLDGWDLAKPGTDSIVLIISGGDLAGQVVRIAATNYAELEKRVLAWYADNRPELVQEIGPDLADMFRGRKETVMPEFDPINFKAMLKPEKVRYAPPVKHDVRQMRRDNKRHNRLKTHRWK